MLLIFELFLCAFQYYNLAMNSATFSFGIIADVQFADVEPWKDRHFRNAPLKLRHAIERFNYEQVDFVVNLGDLIDRDFENFDRIQSLLRTLKVPIWNIAGNHDYEVDSSFYESVHSKLEIPGDGYFAFDHKGWRMIFLNGCEISTFANRKNTTQYQQAEKLLLQKTIQANEWNGGLGHQQIQWLKHMLNDAEAEKLRTAIFCHFPVYPSNKHNLLDESEAMSVIAEKSPDLWISGHNHHGNFGQLFDTWFITMKGMVETEEQLCYAIAEFSEASALIRGFGRESSYNLHLG